MRVCESVFLVLTEVSAFFNPRICGEVGGQVSLSSTCFNLSLSAVRELRAVFIVLCTIRRETERKMSTEGKIECVREAKKERKTKSKIERKKESERQRNR